MSVEPQDDEMAASDPRRRRAMRFIVLLGVVSLFGDIVYEGGRSITGPYLGILGASAAVVGIVAGFGELVGYGLRVVSGYFSDRSQRYWPITLVGYGLTLTAVPLLALAGRWEVAAVLMILERTGKAIRSPARDAMLSHATSEVGHGWGFGVHEALDQAGATIGALFVAGVLAAGAGYREGFALLAIPAILAGATLAAARWLYPHPHDLERQAAPITTQGFPRRFWMYLAAVALVAAGFADYPLIAFHFQAVDTISSSRIALYFAVAMAADAMSALAFGRLFDRFGLRVLAGVTLQSAMFAPLVFWGGPVLALIGVICWGIGLGAQESIMRAAVAPMVAPNRRGTAYGLFNAGYGLFWFIGSATLGILYDRSLAVMIAFSVGAQLLAIPIFLRIDRRRQSTGSDDSGAPLVIGT